MTKQAQSPGTAASRIARELADVTDAQIKEVVAQGEIERLRALIADMVIYDRASNHPTSREVWRKAREIADAESAAMREP